MRISLWRMGSASAASRRVGRRERKASIDVPVRPSHSDGRAEGTRDLSRRAFIAWTGTAVVCSCAGALGVGGCAGRSESDTALAPLGSFYVRDGRLHVGLSDLGGLLDVGGAVKLRVVDERGSEHKIIVVRPAIEMFRAFADACTHNGRELNYLHQEGLLACCGRSSRFDLEGGVVRGPAEDALQRRAVRLVGGELVIAL